MSQPLFERDSVPVEANRKSPSCPPTLKYHDAGSKGFKSHWQHVQMLFSTSIDQDRSELENSGIRVAFGDYNVTEHWQWRPHYKTSKTVCACKNTIKHQDGRTALGVRSHGSIPLSHSRNIVVRI